MRVDELLTWFYHPL